MDGKALKNGRAQLCWAGVLAVLPALAQGVWLALGWHVVAQQDVMDFYVETYFDVTWMMLLAAAGVLFAAAGCLARPRWVVLGGALLAMGLLFHWLLQGFTLLPTLVLLWSGLQAAQGLRRMQAYSE